MTPRALVAGAHPDAPIAPRLAAFILEAAHRAMEVGAPDLRNRLLDPDDLARPFTREHIRGIGQATPEFFHNVKAWGKPWYEAGVPSAGNGTAMRAASCCASVQRPSASPV